VYFEDKKTSKLDKLSKDKVCQICDGAQGNVCNQARYHLENLVIESISLVKFFERRLAPAGFDLDLENTSSFLSFLFFAGLQGKTPLVVEYVSRIGPEINITSELRREESFGKET